MGTVETDSHTHSHSFVMLRSQIIDQARARAQRRGLIHTKTSQSTAQQRTMAYDDDDEEVKPPTAKRALATTATTSKRSKAKRAAESDDSSAAAADDDDDEGDRGDTSGKGTAFSTAGGFVCFHSQYSGWCI
jgi:hypothetical protein